MCLYEFGRGGVVRLLLSYIFGLGVVFQICESFTLY